ncbi:MAG: hypothetical protein ACTS4U_01045 [Candidatus Hodgkinia cicadicola]
MPLVSLSNLLRGKRRKRLQIEVEEPEVTALGGLFAPIRPFETEMMGFVPAKCANIQANHFRREVVTLIKKFCRKCCEEGKLPPAGAIGSWKRWDLRKRWEVDAGESGISVLKG